MTPAAKAICLTAVFIFAFALRWTNAAKTYVLLPCAAATSALIYRVK